MNFVVEELTDDAVIAAFLENRRLWTAYALCDLDKPYRRHARFLGATAEGRIAAVLLVYTPSGFTGMLPFGLTGGVSAILSTSHDLPSQPFLLVGEEHREAVERHYRLDQPCAMFRMAVNRSQVSNGRVAVAGTHAWSRRFQIGAIGGVFTHPDWRGRGLATATTSAVTQTLLAAGVQDVVLNVRADNEPALRAYARLGFTAVRSYLEGQAVERAG